MEVDIECGAEQRRSSLAVRHPFTVFCLAILGFYILLWGAQWLFPGSAAGSRVLFLVTMCGIVIVRPGWNIRPSLTAGYWAVLFGALLGSADLAAYGLRLLNVPTPYDTVQLNMVKILPGVVVVSCVEELLFRQVMFRWLEQQHISGKGAVLATTVAFGGAHLGPVFTGGIVDGPFYLLQGLYMVWVGLLLGELRRATDSWAMSWAGHSAYNIAVLFFHSRAAGS